MASTVPAHPKRVRKDMLIGCLATLLVLGENVHLTEAVWLDLTNITCSEPSHVVEDGSSSVTSYSLTWDGRVLPPNCRVGFNLTDIDHFQLCVKVETFSLETCAFHMKYFEGPSMDLKQINNCGTLKKEFCANSKELYIKFTVSQKTSSRVAITVTANSRTDKFLIAIGCVLSAAAFGAFFVTMYALRRNANNEGKSCIIWKCLDVCLPEKNIQPSPTLDFTLHTISLHHVEYLQNQFPPGVAQPVPQVLSDPPPPYEPPPPSYEEVHNPKFEGRINIQGSAIDDVRTELTFSGMRL
ncbi:uncharacterized protein LOC117330861 isoform X2 [Pecten maximus]|uniref:uncharacterized protein LOC117330861 isoform X2 n=1 Tax=Pecten maximus TaxID=6579 RepID=UPI001457F6EC|nr:uncharacterized protein LOC117330861 isoform X2 [Pecten maximus]